MRRFILTMGAITALAAASVAPVTADNAFYRCPGQPDDGIIKKDLNGWVLTHVGTSSTYLAADENGDGHVCVNESRRPLVIRKDAPTAGWLMDNSIGVRRIIKL